MFDEDEYQIFKQYLEFEEFPLSEILKETGISLSAAITYLSKYLCEKSQFNN